VINVLYILTNKKEELIELYTMIKYSIFYIEQALTNYVSKYVYDIIFDFCNLPREGLIKFLENFGLLEIKNETQKLTFPVRKKVKALKEFLNKKKIKYLRLQLQNMKKNESISSVSFNNLLRCMTKYDLYHSQPEVKVRTNKVKDNQRLEFLLPFIDGGSSPEIENNSNREQVMYVDQSNQKLNLGKTLNYFFSLINHSLSSLTFSYNIKNSNNTDINTNNIPSSNLDKFFLSSLNKSLTQYTSLKGFMNIDVILNEDSMFNINCCGSRWKKLNNSISKCMFKFLSWSLNGFNMFFDLNEGFFHKHFNVLNCTYNFNENNIIHTFNSDFDSSKKNKIRIFDIPFLEKWNCLIANLILLIWKDNFGLLKNFNTEINGVLFAEKIFADTESNPTNQKEKSFSKFLNFFEVTVNIIQSELFKLYGEVLPDFFLFCNRISKFPLNKYNCIDNLCQHFTNNSIQILLKNNLIFFQPFDIVYEINRETLNSLLNNSNPDKIVSFPNLNKVIEPYLFYIDEELDKYIDTKEKKECFLEKHQMTITTFLKQLKDINLERINYNIILLKKLNDLGNIRNGSKLDRFHSEDNFGNFKSEVNSNVSPNNYNEIKIIETQTITNIPDNILYNFSFLLNLSHYFTYKQLNDFRDKLIDYHKLKNHYQILESSHYVTKDDFNISLLDNPRGDKPEVKSQCKSSKAHLMSCLKTLNKIKSNTENMLNLFFNYLKSTVLKIKKNRKLEDSNNNYMKIGYFLVNFKTIKEENEIDEFYKSDYYYNFINYDQ